MTKTTHPGNAGTPDPKAASSSEGNETKHVVPSERQIDKALEDTFPASDPPATEGATRIEPSGTEDDEGEDDDGNPGKPDDARQPPASERGGQ